jgi:hypothetical protein
MTPRRHDAVDDGAPVQGLDRVNGHEVDDCSDNRRDRQGAVEGFASIGFRAKADRPLPCLADCVSGRSGEHRDGQEAGADDAEREDEERDPSCQRGNASAACREVWMSVMPFACSVAAVVTIMASATRLLMPIPK